MRVLFVVVEFGFGPDWKIEFLHECPSTSGKTIPYCLIPVTEGLNVGLVLVSDTRGTYF